MIRKSQTAFVAFLFALVLACAAPASAFAVQPNEPETNAANAANVENAETPKQSATIPGDNTLSAPSTPAKDSPEDGEGNEPADPDDTVLEPVEPEDDPEKEDDDSVEDELESLDGSGDENAPGTSAVLAQASTVQQTSAAANDNALQVASVPAKASPSISYKAHVQNVGWQSAVSNGKTAGTSGKSLRMEALTVTLNTGGYTGSLQMKAHVQNIGWQTVVGNGATMGTTGRSLRMEAVKLALTGEVSQHYDIFYRAHVQNIGWQDWVSNGAIAGTSGRSLRIEALQIELREKSKTTAQGDGLVGVRYQAHVQNIGWQGVASEGATAGTTGQSLRVEAIRLWLEAGALSGNIEYRVHVQNKGWLSWVKNGAVAGTTGKSLRLEAVEIRLTGSIADKYDVVYAGHVQNIGWQPTKNNGRTAGTSGQSLRVEALQIRVVSKQQRNGWFQDNGSWSYYTSGNKAAGRWVVTSESPIDANPGQQRYWVDTTGKLAVSRAIRPTNAVDRDSYLAYATSSGYVKRNVVVELDNSFYWANNDGRLTTPNTSGLIENAVKWALNIANDNSHGYSQEVRWGPDYDCSSFVIAAFKNAGFNVGGAVYTGNMVSEMTKHGFVWSTNLSGLRRGDIVLVHNSSRQHTELYLGNGKLVGAHISETGGITGRAGDQTGQEISVGNYYNAPWQGYLRAVLK